MCTGILNRLMVKLALNIAARRSISESSDGTLGSAYSGACLAELARCAFSEAWLKVCGLLNGDWRRSCRTLGQATVRCTTRCCWTTRRRACFGGPGATTPRTCGRPPIATWRPPSRPQSTSCLTLPSSPLFPPPWPPCAADSLNTQTSS